jgi:hypothetical protein
MHRIDTAYAQRWFTGAIASRVSAAAARELSRLLLLPCATYSLTCLALTIRHRLCVAELPRSSYLQLGSTQHLDYWRHARRVAI